MPASPHDLDQHHDPAPAAASTAAGESWWLLPATLVAAEGAVLRVTSGAPAAAGDLAVCAAFAFACAAGGHALATRFRRAGAVVSGLALWVMLLGLGPAVLLNYDGTASVAAVFAAVAAYAAFRGAIGGKPPSCRTAAVAGVLSIAFSWALEAKMTAFAAPDPFVAAGMALIAIAWIASPRRTWPVLAAVALLPAFSAPTTQPRPTAAAAAITATDERPDVLLLSVDALRSDRARSMQVYRQLAARGVVFDGQSSSSWTVPAVASMLTGLEPQHHGAGRVRMADDDSIVTHARMKTSVQTLGDRLRELGYTTCASIRNPLLGPELQVVRGFDRIRRKEPLPYARPAVPWSDRYRVASAEIAARLGALPHGRDGAESQVEDALAWARRQPPDRPLFVWVHAFEPHLPYREALGSRLPLRDALQVITFNRSLDRVVAEGDMGRLRVAYDHEVDLADRALARLVRDWPAGRRAIVVFTADHGEEFWDHQGFEHGHTMYQELLSIPLIVTGIDGLSPGTAGLVDVVPTVLAALGAPADGLDGEDLATRDGDAALRSQNVLWGDDPSLRAVRIGHRKVIQGADGLWQFDLAADPGEHSPLAADPELAAQLPELLQPPSEATQWDPERAARLRAVGYVE